MSDIEIKKYGSSKVKQYAIDLENSMDTAYSHCKTLKSMVYSASWKGEIRDQFITYIEIIEQYHKELNDILEMQTEALGNIEKYRNNFSNDLFVKAVNQL